MYERYLLLLNEHETTSAAVSRATGIPASTFSDWKSGKSKPKWEKIKKISEFFNVNPDWLLGKTDRRTPENTSSEFSEQLNYLNEKSPKAFDTFNRAIKSLSQHDLDNMLEFINGYINGKSQK